jgi:hypothetical protein
MNIAWWHRFSALTCVPGTAGRASLRVSHSARKANTAAARAAQLAGSSAPATAMTSPAGTSAAVAAPEASTAMRNPGRSRSPQYQTRPVTSASFDP